MSKKIMVVDDEPDILLLIKSTLRRYAHDIDTFSESTLALDHFQQSYRDYRLLLVGVRMRI